MPDFKSGRRSSLEMRLDSHEADLLRRLVTEMRTVLAEGTGEDPVHDRLFPAAYDDPEDTKSFRDLVGDQLQDGKLRSLDMVGEFLGERGRVHATLSPEQVQAWLTTLTDLRLAIGVRTEVTEEKMQRELDVDDPEAPTLAVLHWLGWMQEMTLERITP